MISASEFKKHISKHLREKMRDIGFKGTGFSYLSDSEHFVFAFGIQASQYGGQCCAEYGIQPKEIDSTGNHKLDFKNLKYFNCELRTRLTKPGKGDQWWNYSELEEENIKIAQEICDLFVLRASPTISAFKNNPNILDKIEISDLENSYINVAKKLNGIFPPFGDIRFAWAMMRVYEKKSPGKALEFAKYGLSKLDSNSNFFAKPDFEKMVNQYHGA